jgi:hypothetical protein
VLLHRILRIQDIIHIYNNRWRALNADEAMKGVQQVCEAATVSNSSLPSARSVCVRATGRAPGCVCTRNYKRLYPCVCERETRKSWLCACVRARALV